jgi:cytochrome P450
MQPRPPGPKRLLGRRYALQGLGRRPLNFIMEMAQRYGDLVYFRSWRTPIVFVNHPDLVREVLVSRSRQFVRADAVRKALRIFDGESILVSEGDQWRQQRRLLQKGFRSDRLRGYARKAVERTEEMLGQWPASGTIRAGGEMSRLCMRTLSDMLFGTDVSAEVAESIRMVLDARALETGEAVSSGRARPAAARRDAGQALVQVHRFLDEMIQRRRVETEDRGDMLGMLVRMSQQDVERGKGQAEVDRQVRDETISMINASLDATAAAMSWTLCLVAKHAAVQTRLRQEIERVCAGPAGTGTDEVELPFSEMVVHESLRLYPPNWVLITRRCVREASIGGYRIPRGSWLYIFPYVIHRDPRWFASPDSFDPDRFSAENFGPRQRTAYIPLGLGPHVCIGKALSTILITSMLARILRQYTVELGTEQAELEAEVGIVVRPKESVQLHVTRTGPVADTAVAGGPAEY